MNEDEIRKILQEELGNIAPEANLQKLDYRRTSGRRSRSIL